MALQAISCGPSPLLQTPCTPCTLVPQQSAAERRIEPLCQILHLSVQLQHPLISASPGLSIQQTLVTDSTSPLVLLQTLHCFPALPPKWVHSDVRKGVGFLTSDVIRGGVLWT
ncbi:unnamed protein product, partial [Staurois parvus]